MISLRAQLVKRMIRAGSRELLHGTSIKKRRRSFDLIMRIMFPTMGSKHVTADCIAGVPVEWIAPMPFAQRTIVYVHGGGFALGSSRAYWQHMTRLAKLANARVLAIEYSLAPEHPYPHAVNEVRDVWQQIVKEKKLDATNVAFVGDSAGANIMLAAMLKLRDESLPLPACLVLLSAGVDATLDGESYEKNEQKDPMFTKNTLNFYVSTYTQQHDTKDPLVSPVFAQLHDLPPMLIHIGSDEMLLSSSKKLYDNAKRDGVDAQLVIGDGMWHNWHLFAGFVPESKAAMQEVGKYIVSHTK